MLFSDLPSSRLQNIGISLEILFPALSLIVVALRIYARAITKNIGWDDAFICAALVMSMALCVTSIMTMKLMFMGIHYWDIPPNPNMELASKWSYAMGACYNPILALVKISVLTFMLRFAGVMDRIRLIIWVTIAFITALMIAVFLVVIFECTPVNAVWDFNVVGYCVDSQAFGEATTILTIFTDIVALGLPFYVFLNLQKLSNRKKFTLTFVFGLGIIVTAFSCVRLYFLIQLYINTDPDSGYSISFVTSAVEANLAIITGSAPALWPLIRGRIGFGGTTAATSQQRYYASSHTGWIRTHGESSGPEEIDLENLRDTCVHTEISKTPRRNAVFADEDADLDGREKARGIRVTRTVDIGILVSEV